MLIGIDGNEANVNERVGVNVWAVELLLELAKITKLSENHEYKFTIYLSKPPLKNLPSETANWKYRVIGPAKFWTRWRLPLDLYLHRPRPDVFLSLSHYAPKFAPMPRVVSIMDLSFLQFPEAFKPVARWQLVNWTKESVKQAAHIIAISEFTKQEVVREYGISPEKITVVYPGVSEVFKGQTLPQGLTLTDIKQKYGISGKYLLFVGTLQPKKNLARLVKAFEIVRQKHKNVQLLIVGKRWGQFAADKEEGKMKKEKGIVYLGYVGENDLLGLMRGAEALVLPSLYEGFGIPAVEAMRVGTPVLASNTTSLPEIVGDAGILFDPHQAESITDAINRLLSLSALARQQLVEKGKIRSMKFDWSQTARKIIKVLSP